MASLDKIKRIFGDSPHLVWHLMYAYAIIGLCIALGVNTLECVHNYQNLMDQAKIIQVKYDELRHMYAIPDSAQPVLDQSYNFSIASVDMNTQKRTD